jgi:hypothetical protein
MLLVGLPRKSVPGADQSICWRGPSSSRRSYEFLLTSHAAVSYQAIPVVGARQMKSIIGRTKLGAFRRRVESPRLRFGIP